MTSPDLPELPGTKELEGMLQLCVKLAYGAGHHFAQHGKHAPSSMMTQADAQATLIRKFQALQLAAYRAGMLAAAQIAEEVERNSAASFGLRNGAWTCVRAIRRAAEEGKP